MRNREIPAIWRNWLMTLDGGDDTVGAVRAERLATIRGWREKHRHGGGLGSRREITIGICAVIRYLGDATDQEMSVAEYMRLHPPTIL